MVSQNWLQTQRGYYNYAEDANLGVAGTYRMGIIIPKSAIILGFWVDTIITGEGTVSDGETQISWGLEETDGTASSPTALMILNVPEAFIAGQVLQGNDLMAQPIKLSAGKEVAMYISYPSGRTDLPLLAGEFAFTIMYTENLF